MKRFNYGASSKITINTEKKVYYKTHSKFYKIINIIRDGFKEGFPKIVDYIICTDKLLFLCVEYICKNKKKFKKSRIKELNQDIQKLLKNNC